MVGQGPIRIRLFTDFLLVLAFGVAAPALLAPIARDWSVILMSIGTFAISLVFLWDGLRMAGRLHHR